MNKKVRAVSILALLAAVVFASNQVGIQRREAALLATPAAASGIWVSQSEIMSRPTTGAEWNSILSDAAGS